MRNLFIGGCVTAILLIGGADVFFGQTTSGRKQEPAKPAPTAASSAAYAELLLKRTELQSELESLVLEYTEEYPKLRENRQVLTLIDREIERLAKVKPADSEKLTVALGKLMLRKIELETDLWNLRRTYQDEHPEVKRAKRRVEIYETAIGEILN